MRTVLVSSVAVLSATGLLSACDGDQGLVVRNEEPTATITSHQDGASVLADRPISLTGRVSDADDPREELIAGFELDGAELCPKGPPGEGGEIRCETQLSAGEQSVSLVVVDPNDATGQDTITLDVQPTAPPQISLSLPTRDGTYYADEPVPVQGTISDAEDAVDDLIISLESSKDGPLDAELSIASDGSFSGELDLSSGRHDLLAVVQDTDRKTGQATVRVQVRPPNQAPTCAWDTEAGASELGLTAVFDATVADPDQAADTLSVAVRSDRDGELGTPTPDTEGAVRLSTDALTAGPHVLTLSVTDQAGDTCSDTLEWAVGRPPSLTVVSPGDGDVVTEGSEVAFELTVADEDDAETDLSVRITSDLDGELAVLTPDSGGSAGLRTSALTRGRHALTQRVTDPIGLYREVRQGLTINGRPSAPVISLAPDPARTADDLVVSIDTASVDPEGDPVTYTYAWTRNGSASTASTSDTLPASATEKGETWAVSVTPSDGLATGTAGTASLGIDNTPPTTGTPTVSPTSPTVEETVTCTPTGAADADGDSVSHTFAWTVNGVADTETSDTFDASTTTRGDRIVCTVTPTDGTDAGTAVSSAAATVSNSVPSVDTVSVTPASPTADDTLTCAYTGFDDADGDTDVSTYAWTVGGSTVGSSATLSGAFAKTDTVTCTVTPFDGIDSGTDVSASVTVVNKAPSIASVAVSPASPDTTDALTCSWTGFSDVDGDSDASTVEWSVGGSTVGTSTTLAAGTAERGDEVTCTVTPSDGSKTGTPVSAKVTLDNAEPSVSAVSISPRSPTVEDTLTCSWTFSDPDGDSDASTVGWTRSTSLLGTSTTLSSGFAKGDSITCTVTPNDGTDTGTSDTDTVLIGNAAPKPPVVSFSPSEWIDGSTTDPALSCVATGATDPDGDGLTTTYAWYVNSTLTATLSSKPSDLDPTQFSGEDEVECEVTVSDGSASASASETIDIFEQPDWGAIQFPCSQSVTAGGTFSVYGRVYMGGVTDGSGQGPGILGEAGIGPDGSDPTTSLSGWTFTAGSYNTDLGNDDEYAATLTAPSTAGSYDVAWRFSADGGLSWIYVDQHSSCGSGLSGYSDGYSAANSTPLTVTAP